MQRTVVIVRNGNNADKFVNKHTNQVEQAIGYLSHWGFSQWDTVRICVSSDVPPRTLIGTEISAVYHNSQNNRVFQIVGIWDEQEKKFTFHS